MHIDDEKLKIMQKCLKEFREDLADSLAKEVAASQLKSKYLNVISHQTRTPLSGIKLMLETLLSETLGPLTSELKEAIQNTYDNSSRIITVLNDVFLAQDIEDGNIPINPKETDLDELLLTLIKDLENDLLKSELTLEFTPHDGELKKMSVDPEKMERVFRNLILNAINYSRPGSSIQVELSSDSDSIHFKVTDVGIGIPAADQPFIFDRFFRASNASVMFTDSSGLGLYIVKFFVSAMNGTLDFESEEGKGSTFHFTIKKA